MPNNYLMNEMFLRDSSISNGSTVGPHVHRLRICGYGGSTKGSECPQFWSPWEVLEPIPQRYQEMTVLKFPALCC